MPADLLLYGDTERYATLRHEVPLAIGDPFLFAEVGGRPVVVVSHLEHERVAKAMPDAELIPITDLGFFKLLESGRPRHEILLEIWRRGVQRMGISAAVIPGEFPVALADLLRADGVDLTIDQTAVEARRRAKSPAEMQGMLRAQRAAEAGMAAARDAILGAQERDGWLVLDGEPLTSERVRDALRAACAEHGAPAPPDVMVVSIHQGFGHEPGSGPLPAGLPIEVDLWPRDETSGCWADMTRTFLVGDVPERIREQERLVREALDRCTEAVRPGVTGRELHAIACDIFEAAGYRTQRTGPGDDPTEGFQFSLGHGIGLEVHEAPILGQAGHEPLVAGDVLALEPGLWEAGLGGVRYEDLVLVTADGYEVLTDFPYEMTASR